VQESWSYCVRTDPEKSWKVMESRENKANVSIF